MKILTKQGITGLLLLALMAGGQAFAQERTAYKHVDANGKITYSQTPPVDGKDAKSVNIAPAQRGRGGNAGSYSSYDDPRYYANQPSYYSQGSGAQSSQTARDQRLAAVKAECLRQRGADCGNPVTLQYLDSTSIPRRGRY